MSFFGCIGNLMSNSGLEDVLSAAFGGVKKMLSAKNFPQNFHALRMVVEILLGQQFYHATLQAWKLLLSKPSDIMYCTVFCKCHMVGGVRILQQ